MHNGKIHFEVNELIKEFDLYFLSRNSLTGNIKIPVGTDGINFKHIQKNKNKFFEDVVNVINSGKYNFTRFFLKKRKKKNGDEQYIFVPTILDIIIQRLLLKKYAPPIIKYPITSLENTCFSIHKMILDMSRKISFGNNLVLHLDLISCTLNIDRNILSKIIYSDIANPLRDVFLKFVKCCNEYHQLLDKGLPLGTTFASALQNLFLRRLDSNVMDKMQENVFYYRYVDDIFVVSNSVDKIYQTYEIIKHETNRLNLHLHEKVGRKKYIIDLSKEQYIDFLYYRFNGSEISLRNKLVDWYKGEIIKIIESSKTCQDSIEKLNNYLTGKINGKHINKSLLLYFSNISNLNQAIQFDKWIARTIRKKYFNCNNKILGDYIRKKLFKVSLYIKNRRKHTSL